MSEKSVNLREEIILSEADTESVVGSARTPLAISINLHVPLKKMFLWRWARRVRMEFWNSFLLLEIIAKLMKTGKEAHIEGEDVDVVCGAPAIAISGFELQSFNFSEVVHRGGLEVQSLSEGVIDTTRPPQCEFSNLHSSLAFGLLEEYDDHSCFP